MVQVRLDNEHKVVLSVVPLTEGNNPVTLNAPVAFTVPDEILGTLTVIDALSAEFVTSGSVGLVTVTAACDPVLDPNVEPELFELDIFQAPAYKLAGSASTPVLR